MGQARCYFNAEWQPHDPCGSMDAKVYALMFATQKQPEKDTPVVEIPFTKEELEAIQEEDAAIEASYDYFNRYIAGDR